MIHAGAVLERMAPTPAFSIILCFLLRIIPRLILPDAIASDSYFHLFCGRLLRERGLRLPKRLPYILINHEYTYPPLYHLFLALFPVKAQRYIERVSGALFDSAVLLVLTFFLPRLRFDGGLAEWTLLLYAVSPPLLLAWTGPRAYSGSPRILAQLFYVIHACSFFTSLSTHSILWNTVSIVAGALVILTANFGVQVLIFFGPLFIACVSPAYLIVLIGSFPAAYILSLGHSNRVLYGQYAHMRFYYRHLRQRLLWIYPWGDFAGYLSRAKRAAGNALFHTNARAFRDWIFNEVYPIQILVIQYPHLPLSIAAAAGSLIPWYWTAWMTSGLIWFALTKFKFLLFIGEGERYLEYSIVPSLLLAVALGRAHPWALIAFVAYSIGFIPLALRSFIVRFRDEASRVAEEAAFFENVNALPSGTVLPLGGAYWKVLYYVRHPLVWNGCNMDEKLFTEEEFRLVCDNFPLPSGRFAEIQQRYQVGYVVAEKSSLQRYVSSILDDRSSFSDRTELLFESTALAAYKVMSIEECGPGGQAR